MFPEFLMLPPKPALRQGARVVVKKLEEVKK
jgi:hypothetical protein